ncbi:GmrSD restriction endonuclease domain-containing protein [Xanthobacter versatilis]|uniref:GmrSD restriction endonuclease domain-containing protein n=1 Tax=Xanthobacter autotrophicus (strain ATCC BAA-1158 / Py2) TaxID=78245 RepID=UPI003727A965
MSTFDSTKVLLQSLLEEAVTGKLQLPDFQRGWVWDDEHVRSLLVSVSRSFPVGAVMLLETGGEARFQTRPVENVLFSGPIPTPETLILDGQQRLTTLTQVLKLQGPVKTFNEKGAEIERFYYLDIEKAMSDDSLEEAFFAVPGDRKLKKDFDRVVTLDLSTPLFECEAMCFPCNQILNSDAWEEALQEFAPDKFPVYMKFRRKVLSAFREYQLPVIKLAKATSKEAVCLVFEKVNTGGVPLSVFELVTASFAADSFNLRDDWFGSSLRKVEGRSARLYADENLASVEPTDFLQAIALLHTYEGRLADIEAGKTGKAVSPVSAKRGAILNLKLGTYHKWADHVEQGFKDAARFLRMELVLTTTDLPYRTQITPLAAMMAHLKERWREPRICEKLTRWYWCGVFGELYGGAVETRIANDLEEVLAWIDDGPEPRTVVDANFQPKRLNTLRSRLSAAYKGLNVLIQREGSKDFFWKASIRDLEAEEVALDIHHIFPKAWCTAQGIKSAIYDSVINKTPISYKANRMIGGSAPSEYLRALQAHKQVGLGDAAMDAVLESHRIDPSHLRADEFDAFFEARGRSLCAIVAAAMGKPVDVGGTSFFA